MANKTKRYYTQVPKPVKGSNRKVNCDKCGTKGGYSLEDMIQHQSWCALAQAKAKAAIRQREARARQGANRR